MGRASEFNMVHRLSFGLPRAGRRRSEKPWLKEVQEWSAHNGEGTFQRERGLKPCTKPIQPTYVQRVFAAMHKESKACLGTLALSGHHLFYGTGKERSAVLGPRIEGEPERLISDARGRLRRGSSGVVDH
jgi:hypothetical protein